MKKMLFPVMIFLVCCLASFAASCGDNDPADDDDDNDNAVDVPYPIVDTDQAECYDTNAAIACGDSFVGQDAQYAGRPAQYQNNGDGTVTDLTTGLMWQRDPGEKMTYAEAAAGVEGFTLAGHDDWRLPTIKELYSLMQFSGTDPSGIEGTDTSGLTPFIDADFFVFHYGDTDAGERLIDSQWVTSTLYQSTVMGGNECFFGVNFADGRIKCYPTANAPSGYYAIYVRQVGDYARNDFQDNGDGTIADAATGLVWQQDDNGEEVTWENALAYCENLVFAGHDDWRLPNAKELQSIVDYTRSPDVTASAAIDPLFGASEIVNEAGDPDYPCYWAGTTHVSSGAGNNGGFAVYVAFGRAMGYMDGNWIDVHGAGAQRSDPKVGDPADFPAGHGPQGDAIRIYNYVRCVRAGQSSASVDDDDDAADDDGDDDDNDTSPDQPPQEAVDACEGHEIGDDCEFEGLNGETLTGTCQMVGEVLACVPESSR